MCIYIVAISKPCAEARGLVKSTIWFITTFTLCILQCSKQGCTIPFQPLKQFFNNKLKQVTMPALLEIHNWPAYDHGGYDCVDKLPKLTGELTFPPLLT